MKIRRREPDDDDAIRRLNDEAFGSAYESQLVAKLRKAGLAEIELVATDGGAMVGHILFSALFVKFATHTARALALAPMSVQPERQRHGIGGALIHAGLEHARSARWQAVIVLGHKTYYPRFGFSAALASGLKAPFSGDSFMALEFDAGTLAGRDGIVVYPPAFDVEG